MNLNMLRLSLNLLALPFALVGAAVFLSSLATDAKRPVFAAMAGPLAWLEFALWTASLFLLMRSAWLMWRASQGKGDLCNVCLMPTRLVSEGRYGPYFKCMACGSNQRAME